jgi:AcrR family transcriptional regulator
MSVGDDHDARRREIAHAVWSTVSAHGIQGTTMRRVAAAGAVSVGRIQHYFASREELLRYSCQAMVDLAATIGAADQAAQTHADDPQGALQAVRSLLVHSFDQSAAFRLGARVWAAYVAQAVVDDGIAAVVIEAQQGLESEVARLLAIAGRDPSDARYLVALSEGLAQRTLTGALDAQAATHEVEKAIHRLGPAPR